MSTPDRWFVEKPSDEPARLTVAGPMSRAEADAWAAAWCLERRDIAPRVRCWQHPDDVRAETEAADLRNDSVALRELLTAIRAEIKDIESLPQYGATSDAEYHRMFGRVDALTWVLNQLRGSEMDDGIVPPAELITLIVNEQARLTHFKLLKYENVLELAGMQGQSLTVTYRKANEEEPDGTLSYGQSVLVQDGTIINVADTSRA